MRSDRLPTALTAASLIAAALAAPAAGQVEVVGDKCVLADGKPFFAVGIYSAGVADFPLLAEAGFNLVHTYAWEGKRSDPEGRAWLDAAHENGLKALVGLYRPDVKKMDFEASVRRIQEYRDHPALLAWHTMDEPAWDKEGDMGQDYMPAAHALIKQHDPHHPVTAVVCHFADTDLFMPSVDILQADYYPIPPIPADWFSGTGFRGIRMFVDKSRQASDGGKPFWFVCQAFNYGLMKSKGRDIPAEWQRFPTLRELRTMTYTAVASGARGILYWSLGRLRRPTDKDSPTADENWERLKTVTLELKELLPLLTADTPETIQEKDRVVAMVKSDGEDTYIIAANYERRPTETVIEVPGIANATAEVMFGEGAADIRDGKLAAEFEALESRVYRLRQADE
jgi:hypothetical protein